MQDNRLVEVRCPVLTTKGSTVARTCGTLCGKVSPVSMCELKCRKCKIPFEAIINADGDVAYMDFDQPEINTSKSTKKMTAEDRLLELVNG